MQIQGGRAVMVFLKSPKNLLSKTKKKPSHFSGLFDTEAPIKDQTWLD